VFIKSPLIRRWRWWMAAGAATLVVFRQLKRKRFGMEAAVPEMRSALQVTEKARAEQDRKAIFSLARRFGATRSLQTDVGRDDCLRRAAEVVLQSPTAAGAFVTTYRDSFRQMCRAENARGGRRCEKCGGAVVEGTAHDEVLREQLPMWTCIRCGAETPR
jgi:hypothetical protein